MHEMMSDVAIAYTAGNRSQTRHFCRRVLHWKVRNGYATAF
jgi:hypothetical protein